MTSELIPERSSFKSPTSPVGISANSTLGECARSGISVLVGFLGSFIHSKSKAPSAFKKYGTTDQSHLKIRADRWKLLVRDCASRLSNGIFGK